MTRQKHTLGIAQYITMSNRDTEPFTFDYLLEQYKELEKLMPEYSGLKCSAETLAILRADNVFADSNDSYFGELFGMRITIDDTLPLNKIKFIKSKHD